MKPKITIVVSGGCVQDVIRENIGDVDIVIHDYDVDNTDPSVLKTDENDDEYQELTFES